MMKHLVAALLACATFGCAADGTPSRGEGSYRTGSRLPSYDPASTAATREVSGDDWNDARRTGGMQGTTREPGPLGR
jgi:hypothetical protein